MGERPAVLTVDDKPENLNLLEKLLGGLDVDIYKAYSGEAALALTREHDFCVAVVDVQMPIMNGYELVERMHKASATAALPVIFVSAVFSDDYHYQKGYDAGAVDFLSKPFVPDILISKVRVFIDLYKQRQRLQNTVEKLNQANAVLGRRSMQLATSSLVSQQVTGILELDKLLPEVVGAVRDGFGYALVRIWLVNQASHALTLQADSDQAALERSVPLDSQETLIQVWRSGNPHLSKNASSDQHSSSGSGSAQPAGLELVLPIHFVNETLGVLEIQDPSASSFSPDDVTALQVIADQVAIAIRNANLYTQLKHFNEQLESTVQKRTEELQRAYQTLEKLDKTKSNFIEIAGHELRTPLTLIRGYAAMLTNMVGGVAGAPEMVQGIITGEERLTDIVSRMLDVSRIDNAVLQVHREPVSLSTLLSMVKASLADNLAQRNLAWEMEGVEQLPIIQADGDLLQKMFHHLLSNAIKFTPDGGRITIAGAAIRVGQSSGPDAQAVEITISDTGIGIDPAHHELIFEKFYQTGPVRLHSSGKAKFKGGGPGLGLAIARGIVAAHGGRIWVESPGHDEQRLPGSCFHVVLPLGPNSA